MGVQFKKGDFIEVEADDGEFKLRGTALNTRYHTGWAAFTLRVENAGMQIDVPLNLNYCEARLLFSADVARAMVPGSEEEED